MIRSEGDCIDEIVENYLSKTNALSAALSSLPVDVQKKYDYNARIGAILNVKCPFFLEFSERFSMYKIGKSAHYRNFGAISLFIECKIAGTETFDRCIFV